MLALRDDSGSRDTLKAGTSDPFLAQRRMFRAAMIDAASHGSAVTQLPHTSGSGNRSDQVGWITARRFGEAVAAAPDADPAAIREFYATYDGFCQERRAEVGCSDPRFRPGSSTVFIFRSSRPVAGDLLSVHRQRVGPALRSTAFRPRAGFAGGQPGIGWRFD